MKISKVNENNVGTIRQSNKHFTELVKDNKNFIEKIISKFEKQTKFDNDFKEDLRQGGYIALWKALYKFDSERTIQTNSTASASFSTFAYWCIFNDMLQKVKKMNLKTCKESPASELEEKIAKVNYKIAIEKDQIDIFSLADIKKNGFRGFEDDLIMGIEIEENMKKMSPLDKKIYDLKINKRLKRKQIAEELNMNIHTFKMIYRTSFKKRMIEIFGKDYVNGNM